MISVRARGAGAGRRCCSRARRACSPMRPPSWRAPRPAGVLPPRSRCTCALLAAVQEATAFPLTFYRGFCSSSRYGLSSETARPLAARSREGGGARPRCSRVAGAEVVYCPLAAMARLVVAGLGGGVHGGHGWASRSSRRSCCCRSSTSSRRSTGSRSARGSCRCRRAPACPCSASTNGGSARRRAARTPRSSAPARTRRIIVSDTLLARVLGRRDRGDPGARARPSRAPRHSRRRSSPSRRCCSAAFYAAAAALGAVWDTARAASRRRMWRACRCCCSPAAP